jgi:predicted transcriptional regulator
MPNNSQIFHIKVEQYNKVLEVLTEPMTVQEIADAIDCDKALIQYYMVKLLKNSFQTGLPILTREKSELKLSKNNLPQHIYIRHVSEITLNDLVHPEVIEKHMELLEAKNKLSKPVDPMSNTVEVKQSHVRSFYLLSDPSEKQLKTLQAAEEARREDNRKKNYRTHIGGSFSDAAFI